MRKLLFFFWLFVFTFPPARAEEIIVLPVGGVVSQTETYRILLSDLHFSPPDRLVLRFPNGFGLTSLKSVKAFLEDEPNQSFSVKGFQVAGNQVEIEFHNNLSLAGRSLLLELDKIQNAKKVDNFQMEVSMVTGSAADKPAGLVSERFKLVSEVPAQVVLVSPAFRTVRAGESVPLEARGFDRFGNPVENLSIEWKVTPSSAGNGIFFGDRFFATRAGRVEVIAQSGRLTSSPAVLQVLHGPLDHFEVSGAPESTVAGVPFPVPVGNVTVTAKDNLDSIVTDFADTVFFSSDDPLAVLPPPYRFTTGAGQDNGVHTFPGSQFTLKTAGNRRITVSSKGKTGTSASVRVTANILNNYLLLAAPEVIAGTAFDATVLGAVDLYGNPTSGTIIVSAFSGGGPAPNGAQPAYNPIIVFSGSGQSRQTLVATAPTVLRGTAGTVTRTSNPITVRPAALGAFSLALLPDTLTAGDSVSTFPAEVKDQFGNLKTDFSGPAFFASSDPNAFLQYPAASPYAFISADSGRHPFRGASVKFFTRGAQSLTFGNNSLRSGPVSFSVLPGPAKSFVVSAPPSAVAGNPFSVSIQNAADSFGNLVSLSVQIGLKTGSGIAPSGDGPILPLISVLDGSGQGTAILPKAEKVVLEGSSGPLHFSSDTVVVSSAGLERFDFVLSSPQISGVPFVPPATLTARDRFGNLKGNFNAASDSVVITSQPPEVLEKNVLKQAASFVFGVADLNALGTTFFGSAGGYIFTAVSQSGKSGTSGPVEARSLLVDSFSLSPKNLIRGQNFSLAFRITNQAPAAFVLNQVKLLAAGEEIFLTLPALPVTLAASERRTFSAGDAIPAVFPLGHFPLRLELLGRYATSVSIKTPVLDSLAVADSLFLRPAVNSLNFERVSKGRLYPLAARLVNQSDFDVVLDSATHLILKRDTLSSTFLSSFMIDGLTLVPRNSAAFVPFQPGSFPDTFPSGIYLPSLAVSGRRDGISLADSFFLQDSLVLETPAKMVYDSASLKQSSRLLKAPLTFTLEVENGGEANFEPDSLSQFFLIRVRDTLTGRPDRTFDSIPGGIVPTKLSFQVNNLPNASPGFVWRPEVRLSGMENGLQVTYTIPVTDSIFLFPQPRLSLDTLWAATVSPQRVNSDQSFPIRFRLFNPSVESLVATKIVLSELSEGGRHLDSVTIPFLAPMEVQGKSLNVPADSAHIILATYRLEIKPGKGKLSTADAELEAPVDRISVLRQRKAVLELEPDVAFPPSARSGILVAGQTLTLSVNLVNHGEAPVSSGQIRLRVTPPLLTFISGSVALITSSQLATFQLLVQDTLDSVHVEAVWSQVPMDSNSAAPAALSSGSNILSFRIRSALGALEVGATETPGPLLFSGQSVSPFSLNFTSTDLTNAHLFLLKKVSIEVSGIRPGVDGSAFDEATFSDGSRSVTAQVVGSRLVFDFSPPDTVSSGESRRFPFFVRPKDQKAGSLRFSTNENLIEAIDSVQSGPSFPALLLKENGQPFSFTSSVFTTAAGTGLAASLVTYPNPFSPPAERLQMAYRLSASSEVELKIYTLTGELVMERTYSSGVEGGRAGVNQIEWGGCNGRGKEVKNGVYLAVIRSKTTGEVVKQKLAVIK